MKLYTEEEIRKMKKSFHKIFEEYKIPTCSIYDKIYFPEPIEVELIGKVSEQKEATG